MTALEAQAFIRLAYHLAGIQILAEPTLKRDVTFLLERAGVAVGLVINVNTGDVLRTLSLAVAAGTEVPLAEPMASTWGAA